MNMLMMLNVLSSLRELRRHEQWTRSQLEAYQAKALQRLRVHAYAESPFYQRFHRGYTDSPLSKLPVLTKSMVMENFDDLVTDRAIHLNDVKEYVANFREGERCLGRYWVNATSGSTGHPGFFLFDDAEWAEVLASFARAHEWAGQKVSLTHRMKMASVASTTPWHMSAQVGATLKSWWMPALRIAANEPLESIVAQLNDWQPEMLVSYASMARILADAQIAGHLCIHPHLVFTSSEVLTDETRKRIEAAWGHLPFNQYAATETGGIAAETTVHQGMSLFEDHILVEVVDEDYRPVPPGFFGDKVLVTVLFNHTQPLIRYELSDSIRLAGTPDTTGLPFARINAIQGRTEDILHLPNRSGEQVAVHPLTFHRVLDTVPCSGWQVVQEPNGLYVLVSGASADMVDVELASALAQALAMHGIDVPPITVQHVATIPKTTAGKAPLIRSNLQILASYVSQPSYDFLKV
jgi:putative adenylate-forming enzyme